MATTSSISVFNPETNLWHSVYCHWDGYLSHNGKILFEHYSTIDLALKLVSEGDMSILGEGYCIYYGRDRGEKRTEAWIGEEIDVTVPVALHERLPEPSFLRKVFALPCEFGKVKVCDEPPEATFNVSVFVTSSNSSLSS